MNKANSILHILAGTERGGCEVNALNLVKACPDLTHYLLVLGEAGPMSSDFANAGAGVRHAAVLGSGMRRHIRAVEEAVAEWSPGGVIVWHGMVALPEILHALRDYPGRVLVHGGNPAHSMSRLVDWRYYLREKFLGRRCKATYVCCSRFVADSFRDSRYLRRFRKVVVANGVLPGSSSDRERQTDLETDEFVIGMTARLDPIKDHATLLRAFAMVSASNPRIVLEIAGDGELRPEMEKLALELQVSERVRFLGMVPDVAAAMRNWDLFVYATTDREGFGIALIEAMMLGLPCLATDTGPIREITGHHSISNLVPPGDSIALAKRITEMIADREARLILADEGREHAEKSFSRDVFAKGYLRELKFNRKAAP